MQGPPAPGGNGRFDTPGHPAPGQQGPYGTPSNPYEW